VSRLAAYWSRACEHRVVNRAALLLLTAVLASACVGSQPLGGPGTDVAARAYRLPFAPGTRRFCLQAADGPFSHRDKLRNAYDFAMSVGTPVHAARAGRVVAVKEDSDRGGSSRSYSDDGNYVKVLHDDGTRAVYLHLVKDGAEVTVGQTVRQGQRIARSGNTGWSALPHLHVHVERWDAEAERWSSVPMQFEDVRGDGEPQMLMWYVSANVAP